MAVQVDQYGNPVTGRMWYGGSPAPVVSPVPSGVSVSHVGGAALPPPLSANTATTASLMGPPAPNLLGGGGGAVNAGASISPYTAQASPGIGSAMPAAMLGFLGGYNNQPGLALVGAKMYENAQARKTAQNIQAGRSAVVGGLDITSEESLRDGAQKALDNQDFDLFEKLDKQADEIKSFKVASQDVKKSIAQRMIPDLIEKRQAYRDIMQTVGSRPVSDLNMTERGAVVMKYVQTQMPGVLSDEEFSRQLKSGNLSGMIQRVTALMGMPATPDEEALSGMLKRMEDTAEASGKMIDLFNSQVDYYDLSGLKSPVPAASQVTRPRGVAPLSQEITGSTFNGLGQ